MGAVISLLWGYIVNAYRWMYPQNVPVIRRDKPTTSHISTASTTTTSTTTTSTATTATTSTATTTSQVVRTVVGKVQDFEEGKLVEVEVGKEKVLIIKEDDTFSAIGAKCTHLKQNLIRGAYSKGRVRCPLHGACFSTKTGDIEDHPACDSLPVFPVIVENDDVIVLVSDEELLRKSAITKKMSKHVPSEDNRVFLILGGGPAGGAAAETLRAEGFKGKIVMINKEKALPYDRPKLSKLMTVALEKCYLRSEQFYQANDIELLLGAEITDLDVDEKTVTINKDQVLKYDKALIATGANCQRLTFIPGYDGSNVHVLRTAEEANRIWESVVGKKVVIVGSSFIGMEVASCIAERCKVIVIGMEKVPFERVLGLEVGLMLQMFHESKGITFMMEAVCSEFKHQDDKVTSIVLKSGAVIDEFDVVIIGAGVSPATNYIKPSPSIKLERDKSIVVDKHMFTGAEGLWAAGDLAKFPLSLLRDEYVRIEHFGMAQAQGVVAAKNMVAGRPVVSCTNVPFFWTVQFGKSVRYCGHALKYEEILLDKVEKDCQNPNFGFIAYYLHNNRVDAVCSLNRDPIVSEVAELMHAQIPITVEELKGSLKQYGETTRCIKSKLYPHLKF